MCLAMLMPANTKVPREALNRAAKQHQDGIGIAIAHGDHFQTYHALTWKPEQVFKLLEQHRDKVCMVHFRMATHGDVTLDNVHPFPMGNMMVAHNGIIWDYQPEKGEQRSDTRLFIDTFLSRLEPTWWQDTMFVEQLEQDLSYNKVIVLWPNGGAIILNEELGTWRDDIWYSNETGFAPKPAAPLAATKPATALPTTSTKSTDGFWGDTMSYVELDSDRQLCMACADEDVRSVLDPVTAWDITHDFKYVKRQACSACMRNLKAVFWNRRVEAAR